MRHGFKAQAERFALSARQMLGVPSQSPIDPWAYAGALGVVVLDFAALDLAERHKRRLLETDSESWSGLTLKEDGRHFVVVNPSHTVARQANTLVHELSHIQLGHRPGRVDLSDSGMMLLSEYPSDQEDEADWLAAAILVPRDALFAQRIRGIGASDIAAAFGVSVQLVEWRLRMTGIDTQLRRSGRR